MPYVTLHDIEAYVEKIFADNRNDKLLYHNLAHTQEVAAHAYEIAAGYNLDDKQMFALIAAAWFHDVGQLFVAAAHHENESIKRMKAYFATKQVSEEVMALIEGCILATKFPSRPKNILQEIICDADTYNFGTTKFKTTDELVRKEMELRTGNSYDNWYASALFLLKRHCFFTNYCKEKLNAGKQLNIAYLQHLLS